MCSYFKSLGCGIGYGYLHRIPTRPFEEGKKISLPGQLPSASLSPLKDGFTEVSCSHLFGSVMRIMGLCCLSAFVGSYENKPWLCNFYFFFSPEKVQLSSVNPSPPLPPGPAGLEQSLSGLSISSPSTTVSNVLSTGQYGSYSWNAQVDWLLWIHTCFHWFKRGQEGK